MSDIAITIYYDLSTIPLSHLIWYELRDREFNNWPYIMKSTVKNLEFKPNCLHAETTLLIFFLHFRVIDVIFILYFIDFSSLSTQFGGNKMQKKKMMCQIKRNFVGF